MTQHTPGPWTATGSSVFAGSLPIAHTFLNPGIDVDHANARLIAAAPDLLKACEAVLVWAEGICETYKPKSICHAAREAIAKATGKES